MNDLNNILNNNEQKIIFLKAILLGIKYGKSENYQMYIDTINNEIEKINNELLNNNNNKNNIKNETIKKFENHLLELENKKSVLLSNIQKLSSNNYSFNYSRINILKTTLNQLNFDIEKTKYQLLKIKETKDNKDVKEKKYNNKNIKNINKNNNNNTLVNELEQTLGNLSNMFM